MTAAHHPHDETLARFATGVLESGLSIVAAIHVAGCPLCGGHVADLEAAAGALLEALPPSLMMPEALALTLAKIDAPEPVPKLSRPPPTPPRGPGGVELPGLLRGCRVGRWRWIGPKIWKSTIVLPYAPRANVLLLRVGPNQKLPQHGHTGTELTQVLSGSFSSGDARYLPGDLLEADSEIDHLLTADPDGECICIVAIEGQMRFRDLVARLWRPFTGL